MSDMKTLKDIKLRPFDSGNTIEDIREAAKEWVLDLREAIETSSGDYTDEEDCEKEAIIDWIETFFNLGDNDK